MRGNEQPEARWDGANKETEELLRTILAGVSLSTGEAFCRLLTQHLCSALKADYACIGELDPENPKMVQMVSIFAGDRFWQEYQHPLAGTPCAEVLTTGRCYYPEQLQAAFPNDPALPVLGVDSYVGVPLKGLSGEPLGVMCVMNRGPFANAAKAEALLMVFASRAAAELERRRWEATQKRAELELKESQHFSQSVAATSLNVLFVYDLTERRNVYANQRSFDVIGYTPKEIEDMGEKFIERLMHPDDLTTLPALAKEYAHRKDGEVFEHVFRMRHKNGEWRWVHRCATILR